MWVPRSYRAGTPHGVVVWIDAGEAGAMPNDYGPVLARLGYLWVGARRSGNGRKVPVRINLALDAAHYMAEHYTLDPRRVVVAGLSGGGKSASRAALLYSEVFAGGVFVVGTDYWRPVPMSANGRSEWPSGFPAPGARHFARARGGRFVLVTGDRDMNRAHIEDVYAAYVADHFAGATLLVVPGMGHEMAPPERFAEALGAFSVQR